MRRIQRDNAGDQRAEVKLPFRAQAELLRPENNGEGQTEQDQRDRVLNPDTPAIYALNGTEQQRMKCQL